jgi:hypothetical protein
MKKTFSPPSWIQPPFWIFTLGNIFLIFFQLASKKRWKYCLLFLRRTRHISMEYIQLCVCGWPWYTPSWGGIWLLVPSYSVRPCHFASLLMPSDVSYRFHLFPIFFVCYWTSLFSSISSDPEVGKVLGYRSLHSKHLLMPNLPPHSHQVLRGCALSSFVNYLVISWYSSFSGSGSISFQILLTVNLESPWLWSSVCSFVLYFPLPLWSPAVLHCILRIAISSFFFDNSVICDDSESNLVVLQRSIRINLIIFFVFVRHKGCELSLDFFLTRSTVKLQKGGNVVSIWLA